MLIFERVLMILTFHENGALAQQALYFHSGLHHSIIAPKQNILSKY